MGLQGEEDGERRSQELEAKDVKEMKQDGHLREHDSNLGVHVEHCD